MINSEAVLSFSPQEIERILKGERRYLFQTRKPQTSIKRVSLYCPMPEMRIVAKLEVKKVLALKPKDLWLKAEKKAGISEASFKTLFLGCKTAYAFQLGKVLSKEEGWDVSSQAKKS